MRTFKGFHQDGEPCPVCNTNDDKDCILVPIAGTVDGMISEAKAIHTDCIDLWYVPEHEGLSVSDINCIAILYQRIGGSNDTDDRG